MRRKIIYLTFFAALVYTGYRIYDNYIIDKSSAEYLYPDSEYTPEKYSSLKKEIAQKRKDLRKEFERANKKKKKEILSRAGNELVNLIHLKIAPYWYTTPWGFHGTSTVPRQGTIACGYFVTTVLQDAGVKIKRSKLAQLASEEMIKILVDKENIHRFSNYTIDKFEKGMLKLGNGIYVTGLDNHTGFTLVEDGKVYFIHSSGMRPYCVVKEELKKSRPIVLSKYRVVGKLNTRFFSEKWLKDA